MLKEGVFLGTVPLNEAETVGISLHSVAWKLLDKSIPLRVYLGTILCCQLRVYTLAVSSNGRSYLQMCQTAGGWWWWSVAECLPALRRGQGTPWLPAHPAACLSPLAQLACLYLVCHQLPSARLMELGEDEWRSRRFKFSGCLLACNCADTQ